MIAAVEFKFPGASARAKKRKKPERRADGEVCYAARTKLRMVQNARPNFFTAAPSRDFYKTNSNRGQGVRSAATKTLWLYSLIRESLIVGNVNLPGSEGDMRIRRARSNRRQIVGQGPGSNGKRGAKTFTTWGGRMEEFRFSELWPCGKNIQKWGLTSCWNRISTFTRRARQAVWGSRLFFITAVFSAFGSAGAISGFEAGATYRTILRRRGQAYFAVKNSRW